MCSSVISLCLPSKIPFSPHPRFSFSFSGSSLCYRIKNPTHHRLPASIAERGSARELSWGSWDKFSPDDYNGWAIAEEDYSKAVKKKGLNKFSVIGLGASVFGVICLLTYFSLSSRGFGFRLKSRANALHGFSLPTFLIKKEYDDDKTEETSSDALLEDAQVSVGNLDDASEAFVATGEEPSFDTMKEQKLERRLERIIAPFTVDSTQLEAFTLLKKLKIIEDDAVVHELCTRREYARWLVRANSQLEGSRKHRINSSAALSGSRIAAFDDVGIEDPDFEHIQSLAEAGIVRSKLSNGNNPSNSNKDDELVNFSPERLISRQDLVSWKAKIEYEVVPGTNEKMSRKNLGFLDVKEISSDVLAELYADVRADEKSIIRAVFGQSKRLQPSKPCTKAQAAVTLTSGRMTEFIHVELSRLEAECIARQNELEEVRSELLERGDIQKYWDKKLEEVRNRRLEVETDYRYVLSLLEEERSLGENSVAEFVREKAALDCQEQLLSSLRAEVTEMLERFSTEKAMYIDEQRDVKDTLGNLQVHYEKLLDTKSILEAEVEALRILRSWVEDEARKSQARAEVLKEAGRRWKWDG